MFNEFEAYLSDFINESEPSDYWYDCAILDATDILKKFNHRDWVLLLDQLNSKSLFWKKRLVECLGDLNNLYELDVLLNIINIDDEDLFISCVDSLRLLNLSHIDKAKKEQLLSKIDILLPSVSLPIKCVLEDFVKKINC